MKDSRGIVKFFDCGYILRFLLLIMLFAALFPAEIITAFYLQQYVSIYLLIASAAAVSLLMLPLAYLHITYYIRKIRTLIDSGKYPDKEFVLFAGSIISGICLVIPGLLTTLLGVLLFFSFPKKMAGYLYLNVYKGIKKDIYEYLKLYSG